MASLVLKSLLILSSLYLSMSSALNQDVFSELNTSLINCKDAPYPESCFDSLKLAVFQNLSPTMQLQQIYNTAISKGLTLNKLLGATFISKKKQVAIRDCQELNQNTLSNLRKLSDSASSGSVFLKDTNVYLNAALANKATCFEGLNSLSVPIKASLVNAINSVYEPVNNALWILSSGVLQIENGISEKLGEFGYNASSVITVASDGSGNFKLIQDAVNFAPNKSVEKTVIRIKEGIYRENVEILPWKTNIVLIGNGRDVTVITGNRNFVDDGCAIDCSATVAVSGDGFLASDIKFENTAGPEKHQAVALRNSADFSALYRCTIDGYQDTLYVQSNRQFYRECAIYGTIDYIFGNAAVVFQKCNITTKLPMTEQATYITAQGRDCPVEGTGITFQKCWILATPELRAANSSHRSYLGRPWRNYSRTVIMESYIDDFLQPEGWSKWNGDRSWDTLYYGEYENSGPGSGTSDRVNWTGYHVMDYSDASNFTVSKFIAGEEWLDSTSFPHDDSLDSISTFVPYDVSYSPTSMILNVLKMVFSLIVVCIVI